MVSKPAVRPKTVTERPLMVKPRENVSTDDDGRFLGANCRLFRNHNSVHSDITAVQQIYPQLTLMEGVAVPRWSKMGSVVISRLLMK